MIKKIKYYWIKFLKFIFKRWIPEPPTREEIFEHLFQHVIKTDPMYLTITCICGNKLTTKDTKSTKTLNAKENEPTCAQGNGPTRCAGG